MSRLVWDRISEHFYETGVDHGVLYSYNKTTKKFENGVAWNGLTAVNESPSGAEPTAIWADNIKYLNLMSAEQYGATIECLTYPDEFDKCNGLASLGEGVTIGQQAREIFGFCYRTLIGNDTEGTSHGYKLHLVYNATASPSEQGHSTVNDSPEAGTLSFSVSTTPVDVPGFKPTATVVIDSTKVDSAKLKAIEALLYGTDAGDDQEATIASLPLPEDLIKLLAGNGDGDDGDEGDDGDDSTP